MYLGGALVGGILGVMHVYLPVIDYVAAQQGVSGSEMFENGVVVLVTIPVILIFMTLIPGMYLWAEKWPKKIQENLITDGYFEKHFTARNCLAISV